MKKVFGILLAFLLICALAVPALAADLEVIFTADSKAEPGCRLTVDKGAMLNLGSHTAETYNAMLEGNVVYRWYKNGKLNTEGIGANSYQLTQADAGCSIYVVLSFYEDAGCTQLAGTATSREFKVAGGTAVPAVTTQTLPDATVGVPYAFRLECTDGDAVFSEFMGSQLSEFGLTLTQHGEIEGTPTKAGNCHVNVQVQGEGGEDSVSFDMTVSEAAAPTQPPVTEATAPNTATEGTAPTPTTEGTAPAAPASAPGAEGGDLPYWIPILIGLAAIAAGVGVACALVGKKQKS